MHGSPHERLPRYEVYDAEDRMVVGINTHESATVTWKWGAEPGTGTLALPGTPDPELWRLALNVHNSPLFVSVYTPMPLPWTGRVTNSEFVDDGDGPVLELTLVNDKVWADAMMLVPNPAQPAGLQDRLADVRTGPLATVIKDYLAAAAARLRVPVVVVPPDQNDPSPVVTFEARMDKASDLFGPALDEYGYGIVAYTYRYGDNLPLGMAFTPDVGTVILDVVPGRDTGTLLWQQEHLQSFSVSSSEPQAYRAYVGLDGSGEDRTYMEVVDTEARDRANGKGLPETFVDAPTATGDGPQPESPRAHALRTLRGTGGLSVEFTVADGQPWLAGDEWRIGDMAYTRIGGSMFSARIAEVTMTDSADNPMVFTPVCGAVSLSRPEAVADAVASLVAAIKSRDARR